MTQNQWTEERFHTEEIIGSHSLKAEPNPLTEAQRKAAIAEEMKESNKWERWPGIHAFHLRIAALLQFDCIPEHYQHHHPSRYL